MNTGLLNAIARAGEDASHSVCGIRVNDALHTGVCACAQEEQSNEDDGDVEGQHHIPVKRLFVEPVNATINSPHSDVCYTPEDESKEGVKEGGHQRE